MNILRCVLTLRRRNTRNKKLYRRYIADLTEGSDDIFDTKTLNLAVSISILTLRVQLVFANNRERVYFGQPHEAFYVATKLALILVKM